MRKLVLLAAAAACFAITAAPASAYNDFSCRPSAAHPEPIVLVHGTFANSAGSWNLVDTALRADGYCTFALDYGNNATGPIEQSAQQLADFVDRVLAATGAAKVSIVGHSQGGMMPRYYVKNLGGDAKVDDLVSLAASNHGTQTVRAAGRRAARPAPSRSPARRFSPRSTPATSRPAPSPTPRSRRATTRWSRPTPRPSSRPTPPSPT